MHYYLYEIRNNINNKIYIGVHKTKSLEDGYMGSGKIIKSAIKKYGIENFTKTILETFPTQEEMFAREKELVNEEFLARDDTYNLCRGGHGGFDYVNSSGLNYKGFDSASSKSKSVTPFNTEEFKKLQKERGWAKDGNKKSISSSRDSKSGFFNNEIQKELSLRSQSVESREKRKNTFRENGHQQGEKNSSFGTMWITDNAENRKIKKTDPIPDGWRKGRFVREK